PTVTSGLRVQFSLHSGPTQFRSHTSAALAGSEKNTHVVIATATDKIRAVRISGLHTYSESTRDRGCCSETPLFVARLGAANSSVAMKPAMLPGIERRVSMGAPSQGALGDRGTLKMTLPLTSVTSTLAPVGNASGRPRCSSQATACAC